MAKQNNVTLLTGATSGIGKELAKLLSTQSGTLVLVVRDHERGAELQRNLARQGARNVDLLLCDLSSQAEIKQLASGFSAKYGRLDLLINNAGIMKKRRELSVDGIEMTFAVNHIAVFLLTNLLLELLKASAPSRVITVSSAGHYAELTTGRLVTLDLEDLNMEENFDTIRAYSRSKLANVLFTYELARRLHGTGVVTNCLHPGSIRTKLGREMPLLLVQIIHLLSGSGTPKQGADAVFYVATSPETAKLSGIYFNKTVIERSSDVSYDERLAKALWHESARMTKN